MAVVTLEDKYVLERGRAFLTGTQALVRIPLEHLRAERDTAVFASGYQGSPLGTFDTELQRALGRFQDGRIVHRPAVNEELAATSVWGSQLVGGLPGGSRYAGVTGIWYGKGPGLDRAADAIRHANHGGTSPAGGVVALVGDDPACKSSTLPSGSEPMLAALMIPTLYPGDVQEIVEYGRHAIALSRACGLWAGLRIVTSVADGAGTADLGGLAEPSVPLHGGRPYRHVPSGNMLAPESVEMERSLVEVRVPLALEYARLNGLNRIAHDPPGARLGVVAAGKSYRDLARALDRLGVDPGLRVLKLGMVWPLEPEIARRFARGLDEILVVEEKRPLLEDMLRAELYGTPDPPRILGKRDAEGRPLLPSSGELDADAVARAIVRWLGDRLPGEPPALPDPAPAPQGLLRTPFFCSGCPHNTSTAAPDDAVVGAGIGCHTLVLVNRRGKGAITGVTQMGGEGAQWIGMAPFATVEHFVQNLGDGTFHHSGSLAVRAAVAAGVDVTYKLLYNGAVALTGGQDVEGGLSVPALTRWLEAEGVARTIVTAEEPERYRDVTLAGNASVRPRAELEAAQRELAAVPGVTFLVHDQRCAIEKRRLRRRGELPVPAERVFINERVCEGCGDCGAKSNCLSVLPVDTEFGRKTRIHQSSCNVDLSCLAGDCPSFLTVVPGKRRSSTPSAPSLPDAPVADAADWTVRMIGIGGTGVVTMSQVLGMAAHLEGRHVWGLDQTGLSQKGGPVVSDLRISLAPVSGSNRADARSADLYVGFDLLGAADPRNLHVAVPGRTLAVISSSVVPTAAMVLDTAVAAPPVGEALETIARATDGDRLRSVDAQALAERLFGDHLQANSILLGMAAQAGGLPVSVAAVEEALRLNGTAVERNVAAFRWGRASVAAPDAVAALFPEQPAPPPLSAGHAAAVERIAGPDTELHRLVAVRMPELIAYQDGRLADRYLASVERVAAAETAAVPGSTALAETVAANLFKLLAYKDEYEVARLHLDAVERARLRAETGDGGRVRLHLHPPVLRALGMERKLRVGPWAFTGLRALAAAKGLRRTPFDPFRFSEVRRVERALAGEYIEAVEACLARLEPATHAAAVRLAGLPDLVRGYEDVKLRNVERYRAALAAELGRL